MYLNLLKFFYYYWIGKKTTPRRELNRCKLWCFWPNIQFFLSFVIQIVKWIQNSIDAFALCVCDRALYLMHIISSYRLSTADWDYYQRCCVFIFNGNIQRIIFQCWLEILSWFYKMHQQRNHYGTLVIAGDRVQQSIVEL